MPVLDRNPGRNVNPCAIVEFNALDAVARALQRLGDGDAVVADHAILVRKSAVGHGAIIDEALHVEIRNRPRDDQMRTCNLVPSTRGRSVATVPSFEY